MDAQGSIPSRGKKLYHCVQTGSGAHQTTYSVGRGELSHAGKAAGA
jgi:hypothetical protein